MPNSIEKLETEAIEAALSKEWKKAITLNEEILDFDSENVPALNRLARALLELEKYDEAKKQLRKVLKLDPINQTAKRNLDLAVARRKINTIETPNIKDFIKEPGTTREVKLQILTKGITAKKFFLGEELKMEINGHRVSVMKATGELINVLDPVTAEKIIYISKKGGRIKATYMSSDEEKEVTILLKSSLPLFKAEKQDIKPYLKRETIEEDDSNEDESTEEEESQPLS